MAKKAITIPPWVFFPNWEDPTWGTRPIDQVIIAATIHKLADKLNGSAGKAVQVAAAKAVSAAGQGLK